MYFYHLHTSLDSKVLGISVAVIISAWFFYTENMLLIQFNFNPQGKLKLKVISRVK